MERIEENCTRAPGAHFIYFCTIFLWTQLISGDGNKMRNAAFDRDKCGKRNAEFDRDIRKKCGMRNAASDREVQNAECGIR